MGYLMSRGTFGADVVMLVLNTADPGEEFAKLNAGDVNYPTQNPSTAIGEVWSRYVRPRLFHETIAGDAGTTLPAPEVMNERTAANLAAIGKARELCDQSGARFGIVHIPFAGWKRESIEVQEHLLADWAADLHVPMIDVVPAFAKEDAGKLTMDGMHLTVYGNAEAAAEILRQWPVMEEAVAASGPATQK